jgi:periplasmic divalent cation tolerance protein
MLIEKVAKESKDSVFIYTTCANLYEAKEIGFSAVNEKLAISADYWLINSIYPWKKVIQEIEQYMLMITTKRDLSEKLIKHIEGKHSYSVPVLVGSDISMASQAYLFWLNNTLEDKEEYITEAEYQRQNKKEDHIEKLK